MCIYIFICVYIICMYTHTHIPVTWLKIITLKTNDKVLFRLYINALIKTQLFKLNLFAGYTT